MKAILALNIVTGLFLSATAYATPTGDNSSCYAGVQATANDQFEVLASAPAAHSIRAALIISETAIGCADATARGKGIRVLANFGFSHPDSSVGIVSVFEVLRIVRADSTQDNVLLAIQKFGECSVYAPSPVNLACKYAAQQLQENGGR